MSKKSAGATMQRGKRWCGCCPSQFCLRRFTNSSLPSLRSVALMNRKFSRELERCAVMIEAIERDFPLLNKQIGLPGACKSQVIVSEHVFVSYSLYCTFSLQAKWGSSTASSAFQQSLFKIVPLLLKWLRKKEIFVLNLDQIVIVLERKNVALPQTSVFLFHLQ